MQISLSLSSLQCQPTAFNFVISFLPSVTINLGLTDSLLRQSFEAFHHRGCCSLREGKFMTEASAESQQNGDFIHKRALKVYLLILFNRLSLALISQITEEAGKVNLAEMRKCNNTCSALIIFIKYWRLMRTNGRREGSFMPETSQNCFDVFLKLKSEIAGNIGSSTSLWFTSRDRERSSSDGAEIKSKVEINCGLRVDGFMARGLASQIGVVFSISSSWMDDLEPRIENWFWRIERPPIIFDFPSSIRRKVSFMIPHFPSSQRVNNWSTKEKPRVRHFTALSMLFVHVRLKLRHIILWTNQLAQFLNVWKQVEGNKQINFRAVERKARQNCSWSSPVRILHHKSHSGVIWRSNTAWKSCCVGGECIWMICSSLPMDFQQDSQTTNAISIQH